MAKKLADIEKETEQNPYQHNGGKALLAQTMQDVPDQPHHSDRSSISRHVNYARNMWARLRSVLLYWTPARLEEEALRRATDGSGQSQVALEHHLFHAVFLEWSDGLIYWLSNTPEADLQGHDTRHAVLLKDALADSMGLLERKAAASEARAMDLRLRWDHEQLMKFLTGHELVTKLDALIEVASNSNSNSGRIAELAADLMPSVTAMKKTLGSIDEVQNWIYERSITKDPSKPGKIVTAAKAVGTAAGNASLKLLLDGLIAQARLHGLLP